MVSRKAENTENRGRQVLASPAPRMVVQGQECVCTEGAGALTCFRSSHTLAEACVPRVHEAKAVHSEEERSIEPPAVSVVFNEVPIFDELVLNSCNSSYVSTRARVGPLAGHRTLPA